VAKDRGEVGPQRGLRALLERWDGNFVDQLAEEGGLGQNLDVEEGRGRLQGDRRQGRPAMKPAR
jgi:hypothetical protein